MAHMYDVAAKLHADSSGFVAAFTAAEASIARFNKTVAATNMARATNGLSSFQKANASTGSTVGATTGKLQAFNRVVGAMPITRATNGLGDYSSATGRAATNVATLGRANANASTSINKTSGEVSRFNRAVGATNLAAATTNMGTFAGANQRAQKAVEIAARDVDRFNRTARGFAMGGIAGSTAFGAAMYGSLKTFASYESGLAGVKKTVDASDAEYRKLDKTFRQMTTTMPATYEEITAVGEAAGQLGIKKESIAKFTETMIRLGTSTNLSAEEAATSIARVSNVMGTADKDVDRFGATLVALGNNYATTESEIMEMTMRLVGMGKQLNMSEAEVMALSTAMSSVGIKAEMGGSAMSRVMTKMNSALEGGGEKAKAWADVMGMSADKAKAKIEEDAYGALILLLKGLDKSKASGENLDKVLGDLGIKEIREIDTMKRLSSAVDQVTSARELGNNAWRENTALLNESNQRYETFASKMQMVWNRIRNIFANVGGAFAKSSGEFMSSIDNMLAGLERLTDGFFNAEGGISHMGQRFVDTAKYIGAIVGTLGLAGAAFMAFGPAGAVTVGVVAGLGAVVLAVKKVGDIFNGGQITKGMNEISRISDSSTREAAESYQTMKLKVLDSIGDMVTGANEKSLELKNGMLKSLDGMGEMSAKEAAQMKEKVLSELADLTNKAVQEINNSEKRMADLTRSLMKGASDTEKAALEQNLAEQKRIFDRKREIVRDAESTISEILSTASKERRTLTSQEFSDLGTAFSSIDKEFKTSIGNNVSDLARLQTAFDKLDASAPIEKVQSSLTDMAKTTVSTMQEMDKAYEKNSTMIKQNMGDTEAGKQLLAQLTKEHNNQKAALLENLDANEKNAQSIHKSADAMKGLSEEERRALGVKRDYTQQEAAMASISELRKHKQISLADAIEAANKAEEKSASASEKAAKKYLEIGAAVDTIPNKFDTMKKSSLEAATAIGEGFATKFEDGFEGVDITGVGRKTVDEFVEGVRSGELSVKDVAIAQINTVRNEMGQESLTPEGRKTLETFVDGMKGVSVGEVADQMGVDLKSKTEINLGPKGNVTAKSFVEGLRNGTYGMSEFATFLNNRLLEISKVDLSEIGSQDIQTLSAGLQSGLVSVSEVGEILETSLKQNSNIDLTPEGQQTMQTLVSGLQTGKVSVSEFTSGLKQLMKEQSKADLTPEGQQTSNSYKAGLDSGKEGVSSSAQSQKQSVEEILGLTTDGNGGKNATNLFTSGILAGGESTRGASNSVKLIPESILANANDGNGGQSVSSKFANGILSGIGGATAQSTALKLIPESILRGANDGGGGSKAGGLFQAGLSSKVSPVTGVANTIRSSVQSTLGSTTDGQGGRGSGNKFNSGLSGTKGSINGTANSIKSNTQNTLGSTTDGQGGNKSGSMFNRGLSGNMGAINGTATSIMSNVQRVLGSTTDGGGGTRSGSMFVSGLSGQSGPANSAGNSVSSAGKSGLANTGGSFGLGQNLGQGFVNGIASMVGRAASAAASLANAAMSAIKSAQRSASPAKETIKLGGDFTDGYTIGIEEQSRYAVKMAGNLASDSLETFNKTLGSNPFDLGKMTDVKRNINGLRPKMDHMVNSNMKVDMPMSRMRVDVNVHADQEWIRTEVNHGNAVDDKLDYMGR
ncbi:phage tail tape measure protein [Mammaliicoccus sciuri]|uniref:phage tail tape measure protein n=1 Tax=Mammaliicoccus sciuri TaxID=1296 RepID=UPI000D1EB1BE|nr:phage tail tape measure protein [Mammaliicoccus sciuri]PTJ54180.1 phage tail tape measure protein [Mammaliicoccus sciuri]